MTYPSKWALYFPELYGGGPGSGHFGHSGRPGERGGSLPGEGEGRKENAARAPRVKEYHPEGTEVDVETFMRARDGLGKAWMTPDGKLWEFDAMKMHHAQVLGDTIMGPGSKFTAPYELIDMLEYDERVFGKVAAARLIRITARGSKEIGEMTVELFGEPTESQKASLDVMMTRRPSVTWNDRGKKDRYGHILFGKDADSLKRHLAGRSPQATSGVALWHTPEDIAAAAAKFDELMKRLLNLTGGGPGSGHFGHEGRPGERGGSLPGEGHKADDAFTPKLDAMPKPDRMNRAEVAKHYGVSEETVQLIERWGDSTGLPKLSHGELRSLAESGFAQAEANPVRGGTDYVLTNKATPIRAARMIYIGRWERAVGEGQPVPEEVFQELPHLRRLDDKLKTYERRLTQGKGFVPATWVEEFPRLKRLSAGGPGSGHFGHAGRPGERGGSLPGDGGGEAKENSVRQEIIETFDKVDREIAARNKRIDEAMSKLPEGYQIQGPRNQVWTKQTIAGDTFWISQDGKRGYTGSQLLTELGTKFIEPHISADVLWGEPKANTPDTHAARLTEAFNNAYGSQDFGPVYAAEKEYQKEVYREFHLNGVKDEDGTGEGPPPPLPGQKILMMRLGRQGNTKLESAYAANAEGVASFLVHVDDYERPQHPTGDTIHVFEVKITKDLEKYRGGYTREETKSKLTGGVGRDNDNGVIWYSVGRFGYEAKYVGSVSLQAVRDRLEKETGSMSFDVTGGAIGGRVLRQVIQEKLS